MNHAHFVDVQFKDRAEFGAVEFYGSVFFTGAIFNGMSWFEEVNFLDSAWFIHSTFRSWTEFNLITVPDWISFRGVLIEGRILLSIGDLTPIDKEKSEENQQTEINRGGIVRINEPLFSSNGRFVIINA